MTDPAAAPPAVTTPQGLLALYDAALPQVFGYLVARCPDRSTAEDLTAETFLAAVDAVRRDRPPPASVAWLIAVARHKLVDHWRAEARRERMLTSISTHPQPPEDPSDATLDAMTARSALRRLAPQHRPGCRAGHRPDVAGG